MFNSTSSSTAPALSSSSSPGPSSCPPNHNSKSPIIASPSAHTLHAQNPPHPHPHPALVIPLSSCHHFHTHPNLDSSHYHSPLPLASISATGCSGFVCESFSSHSFNTDPHCYTTDCSPRSVICRGHSSSSGPSPDPRRNARSPRSKSHNLVSSSISRPHQPAPPKKHGIPSLHGQHKQISKQKQLPRLSVERSYTMVGLNAAHTHYEAEAEEGNTQNIKVRRSSKLAHEGGLDWQREGQCRSAAVDKPCVNIASKEANGYESGFNHAAAMEARLRSDTQRDYGSDSHLHGYTREPIAFSDPVFNSMQLQSVDQRERIPQHRSYSCNLLNVAAGRPRISSMQSPKQAQHHQTNISSNEFAPKSPDALFGCIDGVANHEYHPTTKSCMQFGSKWEDAEKWLRPVNHHHHATGCRGLIPSFGLFGMSDCMNAGTAIKPHCMNHVPVIAPSTANYVPAHLNRALPPLANCINHSLHVPFSSGTNSHADWTSVVEQADVVVNRPAFTARKFQQVGCFHPHMISCDLNTPYSKQYSLSPHIATCSDIMSRQNSTNSQQLQLIDGIQKAGQAQQLYRYDSSEVTSNASSELKIATEHNYRVLNWNEKNQGRILPLPHPGLVHSCITNPQLTDRFASEECMPCSSDQLSHPKANDKAILMGPGIQATVVMPMVSLREVGTQMSSVDGSGSISRYTSKNGSPQKMVSPARHNTPAQGRSLSGSASNSGNVRRNAKQLINLTEIVECHRAQLELQALSDGDLINSFHRTTSNWSSWEVEEADLSRSLRHSTPELENTSTAGFSHQWPTQSYSWNEDDDAKLARLQLKDAQIQAWEDKKKSKAEAKLKGLEENLAKKRSQTTARIMGDLAAAQRKAEKMRATIYAQQRRPVKKGCQHRPRSLSPVSRCTCFSALQ